MRRDKTPGLSAWRLSRIMQLASILAILLSVQSGVAVPAASIRLRFLDPTSGKPIRKMWVAISQFKDKPAAGPVPAKYQVAFASVKTDANGEAVVQLSDPIPAFISVNADLWYNASFVAVDDVLKFGVLLDYSSKAPPRGCWVDSDGNCRMKSGSLLPDKGSQKPAVVNPQPQPGLLIIVEKRISRWERLRQELP